VLVVIEHGVVRLFLRFAWRKAAGRFWIPIMITPRLRGSMPLTLTGKVVKGELAKLAQFTPTR